MTTDITDIKGTVVEQQAPDQSWARVSKVMPLISAPFRAGVTQEWTRLLRNRQKYGAVRLVDVSESPADVEPTVVCRSCGRQTVAARTRGGLCVDCI